METNTNWKKIKKDPGGYVHWNEVVFPAWVLADHWTHYWRSMAEMTRNEPFFNLYTHWMEATEDTKPLPPPKEPHWQHTINQRNAAVQIILDTITGIRARHSNHEAVANWLELQLKAEGLDKLNK